ncbi:thiamine pyrophosphate-requiring protein [Sphingobium lignivorans]|uniref:Thiamine pyrophosphate-dependent acetolactate synthase large subunit-like protein n=1 Tax=Sphingobium lignivorans TaxID=2735886 RepID=A0ABR6NC49_9SPHN|nr:thiamine pyrophosphate-requiring protein [Sphingobium lignivorans]MBB5984857.1 thiamine pyrophosphate-dependent acetolactate synthase large subunit-like protein [Sphingobium lignivorans]
MKTCDAIVEILKLEGVDVLFGYPRNALLEAAAQANIRTIIPRQERIGLHMADAYSRLTRGEKIGVFCCQHGPGAEVAYAGVAQAYGESVPILVLPGGYPTATAHVGRNFNSVRNMAQITKSAEPLNFPSHVNAVMRRAFTALRNGRGGPALVELPFDVLEQDGAQVAYQPVLRSRFAPDGESIARAASLLCAAKRPVLYAGQGIHWSGAYAELKELAELLAIPVCTSLPGKSSFDETHPLALGSGGAAMPHAVRHFLDEADVILGVGCSFTSTAFGIRMPTGKTVLHATLDPVELNRAVETDVALIGDAKLTLSALIAACRALTGGAPRDMSAVTAEIRKLDDAWLAKWMPKLTSDQVPITPYRVLWDLQNTVDVANTIITHDAGSPRDQLSPFWKTRAPHSFLGWGKTTQLGYGLGLAMGAKLACPDKLCINVWGDAAIGFTGMDFETAVRERLPILSILLNNASMAMELKVMPMATDRFRSTDISGNYAQFATALGGHGERISAVEEIVPAIRRAIAATEAGKPALLEFMTSQEQEFSRYP